MKCDELKAEQLLDYSGEPMPCYPKAKVDAAIAELKQFAEDACLERDDNQAAIDELNAELESLKATHYTESVDAGMENRRLKRALWLARADRAKDKYECFFRAKASTELLDINGWTDNVPEPKGWWRQLTAKEWLRIWRKVEGICRAKAEEYDNGLR